MAARLTGSVEERLSALGLELPPPAVLPAGARLSYRRLVRHGDIAFISGTTSVNFVEAPSNTSGTLTVTDTTHTANITLLGQYVAGQFNIQNDGAGGTLVTDPPVSAADVQRAAVRVVDHRRGRAVAGQPSRRGRVQPRAVGELGAGAVVV